MVEDRRRRRRRGTADRDGRGRVGSVLPVKRRRREPRARNEGARAAYLRTNVWARRRMPKRWEALGMEEQRGREGGRHQPYASELSARKLP